jgi:hypothetical protein
MFLSGSVSDFMTRLHSLPASTGEVALFISEGTGYMSGILLQTSGQWEAEARLKNYQFTSDALQLLAQQF